MGKLGSVFLYFVTLLALFITVTGFLANVDLTARIFQILFLPVTLLLIRTSVNHIISNVSSLDRGQGLMRVFVYYCFIIAMTQVIIGFVSATTLPQIVSAVLFSLVGVYFLLLVWPTGGRVTTTSGAVVQTVHSKNYKDFVIKPNVNLDVDRRDFIKLIGTAGVLAFIFSLFSKRGVPFLSGAPILSTASLTDISGNKINPAQATATDNYSIAEIDDSTTTAYFGFINDKGGWYIMKEDADGSFRYTKGDSDFNTNWTRRANLTYDYFNKVF